MPIASATPSAATAASTTIAAIAQPEIARWGWCLGFGMADWLCGMHWPVRHAMSKMIALVSNAVRAVPSVSLTLLKTNWIPPF